MEVLIGIGGSVAAEIGKSLVVPIKRHFGSLFGYNGNIKDLYDEKKNLDLKIAEANQFMQDAEKKFKVPIPQVPDWKKKADILNKEASKCLEKETQVNGRCQNPWSCYSSRRKVSKMTEDIREKIKVTPNFGNAAYDAPPPNSGSRFILEGFKDFESRLSVTNDVWEALKSDELSMISVCGMGGVGKTTLVKKLVKRVKETENLFDVIEMAVVAQESNRSIQNVIIERLGLKIEEETLDARAYKLHEWIMKCEKSILLILDDVWKELDFEAIGLPLKRDKRYKIVLTSRNDDLCTEMGSQKNFRINILNKEEAQDLFKQTAGDSIDESLLSTATEIADECGGLPIAIVTLARALKSKAKGRWDYALLQLKNCEMKNISVMQKVHSKLELSFDLLESDEAKSCFLLCCLFPEDYNIPVEDLISYGMGLGLFGEVRNLHELRMKVDELIYKLKESFLLLEGDSDDYEFVKMHDLLRDVAISIALSREKYAYLVSHDYEMKSWPANYKDRTAISLIRREIQAHPHDLECPKLQLLRLQLGRYSQSLPTNFFGSMKKLKVLSLVIPELTQPLGVLEKLQTLRLTIFASGMISLIGAPNSLEVLKIHHYYYRGYPDLPEGIGLLIRLRVLNLRKMPVGYIPSGVLSRLSRLEELYVNMDFMKWECIEDGRTNASLKELESHPITILEIGVPNFSVMPNKSVISKLRKFKILIGRGFRHSLMGKDSANDQLYIEGDWNDVFGSGINALLRNVKALGLSMFPCKNCLFKLEDEGFPVDSLKVIPSSEEICQLQNNDPVQFPSFHYLKHIEILSCLEIKYVFPLSMARGLKQLESIKISYCYKVEGIFYRKEVDNDDIIEFPKLKYLDLDYLPKLIGFRVDMDNAVVGHFSDQLEDDEAMNSSLSCKVSSDIQLQRGSSDCIIGASLFSRWLQLQNLQELNLSDCHSLEVVFPASVAGQFIRLKKLHLDSCDKIQYVVGGRQEEEKENKGTTKIVFPMLLSLHLEKLPKLMSFYPDGHTSFDFPSLKEIRVDDCPKMKILCLTFSSLSLMGNKSGHSSLPAENPTIRPIVPRMTCPKIRPIVRRMTRRGRKQKSADTIVQRHNSNQKPKEVSLMKNNYDHTEACCAFPIKSTEGIRNLKRLRLYRHDAFKVIFSFEECHAGGVMLNDLQELHLDSLSELTHIWFNIPPEITAFQNLKELNVRECHSLKYIFSPLVVKLLVKLEKLDIGQCSMMRAIVAEETCLGKIIFPRLKFLELGRLGNLESFCVDKLATVEFALLEELGLMGCDKMMTLSYGSVITSSREDQLNAIVEKKDTFSPFSITSIEGMRNLKTLRLLECLSCQVIFSFEENLAVEMLNNLENLELAYLENLEHVWLKIPPEIKAFQNLKRIWVHECERVKYLFSPLVAKLLVKLKEVTIARCSMMGAVVAGEELEQEAKSDSIVFVQLRSLKLQRLPNLRSFCIKRYVTIELPLLEDLVLTGCNSMRTLCIEKLENLEHVWLRIPPEIKTFHNLKTISVEECDNVEYLFSPPVAKLLLKLEEVFIRSCSMMKAVVAEEEFEEARSDRIVFPQLRVLRLGHLPNLRSFCIERSVTIELPLLEYLFLAECNSISQFSYGSVITPKVKTIILDYVRYPLEEDLNATLQKMRMDAADLSTDELDITEAGAGEGHVEILQYPQI